MSVFLAPPHVYAETPLDQIKAELNSRELDIRIAAVEKLRPRKDEETVDLLIGVVDNRREEWEVQIKAIQLLGEAKNPKALNLLIRIFNSHSRDWECPAIKSYTALALGNFGGEPGVFDALTKGLHDPELLTREASVKALGIIRDEKALPSLIPLLQDKSIAIRLSGIKAIENIGDRRVVPALEIIAEDDSDEVIRHTAKVAISNLYKN
jgi:HEAT repeat protein